MDYIKEIVTLLVIFSVTVESEIVLMQLGDMLITENQFSHMFKSQTSSKRRNIDLSVPLWPNATVPYNIENSFNDDEKKIIRKGLTFISSASCVKFEEKIPVNSTYLSFDNQNNGCLSMVGRVSDHKQIVNLSKGCVVPGIVAHEVMHALGFHHMHQNYNRDQFLNIYLENVNPKDRFNFKKYTNKIVDDYGLPYDYKSIMHYTDYMFSKNGKKTMEPKDSTIHLTEPAEATGLSELDKKKLEKLYCQQSYKPEDDSLSDDYDL